MTASPGLSTTMMAIALLLALSSCTFASAWGDRWSDAYESEAATEGFPVQTYEQAGPVEVEKLDMKCALETTLVCEADARLLVDASPDVVARVLSDAYFWGSLRGASLGFETLSTNKAPGVREIDIEGAGQQVVLGIVNMVYLRLRVVVDTRNPQQVVVTFKLVQSNHFSVWEARWLLDAGRGNGGHVITRASTHYVVRSKSVARGKALLLRLATSAARLAGRDLLQQEALNVATKFVEDFATAITKVLQNPRTPRKELWQQLWQQRVCQRQG